MIIGVFCPVINYCGGAEWVGVEIINTLKQHGHQVIVLSDKPLDQDKFKHVFNRKVLADQQMIFPLRFFRPSHYRNIYTDFLRSLMLKSKCDFLVDTFSNAILPGMDVVYIHHPFLRRVELGLPSKINKFYFLPYKQYLRSIKVNLCNKLIFANSKFTAQAIKAETGMNAHVLYPPVECEIKPEEKPFERKRDNNVVTHGRICYGKNLKIIPYIAKLTRSDISFTIAGLPESQEVVASLLRLIEELNVSDKVKILTNVKREKLNEILLSSKVYLHSALNEHFGVSIVEAMSLGCIPVVPDSGGPREFVPQRFRYNSIAEAAGMVNRAIDEWSPIKAKKVSKYGERFSEDNFSKQFIDIFNSHFNIDN